MFAPNLHPAMKNVQGVRRELKMRTVFNLLGPLANPARAQTQVIGAPSVEFAEIMAEALAELGTGHSYVVHGVLAGGGGLDEVSTTGSTEVYEVWTGRVEKSVWMPEDFGVPKVALDALAGGDAAENARIAVELLGGMKGPRRDIVLVNAAAGLMAGGFGGDASRRRGEGGRSDRFRARDGGARNNCKKSFRKTEPLVLRITARAGSAGARSSTGLSSLSASGPRIREPWPRPHPSADMRSGFADKTICRGLL